MSKPPLEQALHHIGAILGLYWDNGKVTGNDSNGLYRDNWGGGVCVSICIYIYIYWGPMTTKPPPF